MNGNHHTYLAYWRKNKTTELKINRDDLKQMSQTGMQLTKGLLYKCALIPICELLFSKQRQCHDKWSFFAGGISDQLSKIYGVLCLGGFKDPQDIANIGKENMFARGHHHSWDRFGNVRNQEEGGSDDSDQDDDDDDLMPAHLVSEDIVQ